MVQRDYVRKKSQSKSKAKKNKSRILPSLMIFLAVIIIVLFSAILYLLSTNHPEKPIERPKVKTESPVATLPEQPQERWTYLKELETPNASSGTNSTTSERQQILDSFINNSSTTTPTTSTNMEDSKWLLQCGAFKEKTNADTLKASLAMTGISGNITTSQQLYRVTVGPYTNKTDAQKVLNTLKTNGINNCIISN
ncbi:SPOR domain-containing protein [uncultured Gilliamella sp.]|uniref:SPOR domain-containing protein n=1 Tax=unclassified Gilliamella TaxID=2685620 RepID=UPI0004D974D2|nr:SPOR domain-containing protein [uncultured Gilliamella sp.]KES16435.1 Cell division protein [Gilliamella apis SCGC AB-598-P17]MBI0038550.1 SPOR domain-containing protein [Gilliamella sp. B14384G10]MBI0040811.1 SPOR domain-containing protein [Gilliamella sp. B14384G7]MBI0052510.1 SPOR domain-containing protein [Gilliamella sp. B14384G13]MBI0054805.1 SPOR domain-containing protein [Gilliamella sp. B14384H2]